MRDQFEFELKVEEYLHLLFDQEMAVNLKERAIYLVYDYYHQENIVNGIAKMLFKKFAASKIIFLVSNILPLYITGLYSGIVIDGGLL